MMSFKLTWCVEMTLKNSKQEKVLGVTTDNKLNFATHLSNITKNGNIKFVLVITCLRGKFGINLPSSLFEISQFQKMNEVNFPQISRINM